MLKGVGRLDLHVDFGTGLTLPDMYSHSVNDRGNVVRQTVELNRNGISGARSGAWTGFGTDSL